MIEVVMILVFATLVPAVCTAGVVLLLRFWAAGMSRGARTVLAALLGPFTALGGLFMFALVETPSEIGVFLGIGVILFLPILVVGLPVSFFATRKLDRILAPTYEVFE